MKNISSYIGTLAIVKRLSNSRNGNPRFMVEVDGQAFYTAVDSMHGYSVKNFEGKQVEVTIGTHYGKPTLNTIKTI